MGRLLNLLPWRRRRLERELERELRDHIDRRTADLIASGVSDNEARRVVESDRSATARVNVSARAHGALHRRG